MPVRVKHQNVLVSKNSGSSKKKYKKMVLTDCFSEIKKDISVVFKKKIFEDLERGTF